MQRLSIAIPEASHQDHLAASIQTRLARAPATLIGFYTAGDQGVFTHMGSKTHIHCVLDSPLASGHVDSVTVRMEGSSIAPSRSY